MMNEKKVPQLRFCNFEEEWTDKVFSEIFEERHEYSTITEEYPQLSFTIAEGVIRPEDRKTNKRDFLIIDKDNKQYLKTEVGDIIYNPANVIWGAIHRNNLCKGVVSPIYKIFITNQDSTFLEGVVRNEKFIKKMTKHMEGTVQKLKTLKPESFLNMHEYIPSSLVEQQKIGTMLSKIDPLIQAKTQKLESLKSVKKSLLQKCFPKDGEKVPQIRFEGFSGDWEEKKLGEVADFLDSKRIPIEDSERKHGIYPYYGASGIIDYVDDFIFDGDYVLLGEDGANIINRSTSLAFVVTGKCWINNHAHVLSPRKNTDLFFLSECLENQNYESYNTGTAQPKLNQEVCFNILLKIPTSKEEQQKIGQFFSKYDSLISLQQKEIENLKTIKKSLLQKMFV